MTRIQTLSELITSTINLRLCNGKGVTGAYSSTREQSFPTADLCQMELQPTAPAEISVAAGATQSRNSGLELFWRRSAVGKDGSPMEQ